LQRRRDSLSGWDGRGSTGAESRNPEANVYRAEIAADVDETEKEKVKKYLAP